MTAPTIKAVIFDIGGVVLKSPFIAIAQYERELGLPKNYINCSIAARGKESAWQRFERGELSLSDFYAAFSKDLSDTLTGNYAYSIYCQRRNKECPKLPEILSVDGRELFGRMMRGGAEYDPFVVLAIQHLRASKQYKIIALTNNFSALPGSPTESELAFLGWTSSSGPAPAQLRQMFDDFCDSSEMGMRKPEAAFYLKACERNQISPNEAVFLDDIGINLKAAAQLGMETIHVPLNGSAAAVKKLERLLGIDLTSPMDSSHGKL